MSESYWIEWAAIAGVHLVAVASPGPDFTVTLRESLKYGARTGIYTAIGIGSAIFLHVLYSLLGLGLIISQNEWLYLGMKWVAAAYLAYLAYLSLRSKPGEIDQLKQEYLAPPTFWKSFRIGFITNALNPKATLFFLSLYVSIVSQDTPYTIQAGYGLYMAIATTCWFSLIATLFGNPTIRHRYERYAHWIDRFVGVVLLALAVQLVIG
jgi:RhtB (resistance to homoserine/threonine) family protein